MEDLTYDAEKLGKDAEEFIESFKKRMSDIVDETLGNAYCSILPYIETDAWTNYRQALRTEMEHEYKYSSFKTKYAKDLRKAIFVENREEISKLISDDIKERIKELEDRHQEFDMFRYSPGGDGYSDKVRENEKLKECLEFYADPAKWNDKKPFHLTEIEQKGFIKAKDTLKEIEGK